MTVYNNTTSLFSVGSDGKSRIVSTNAYSPLKITGSGLRPFANNAAAISAGLTAGDFYRTNGDPDVVCVVH